MTHYSIVPRTTKYFKEFGFLLFARNLPKKYGKKTIQCCYENRPIWPEKRFQKSKTAAATGELIGNKVPEKIVKPKPVTEANLRNVEEMVISQEKIKEILNELGQVL